MESEKSKVNEYVWGGAVILVGAVLVAVVLNWSNLPQSNTMSENFRNKAWPAAVSTSCALNDAKPENSADQRVADLFEQCFSLDMEMLKLRSSTYMTDSMKEKYDSLETEHNQVEGQIQSIFKDEGLDVAAERKKRFRKLLPE